MFSSFTQWPEPPFSVNFQGSRSNSLKFTALRNAGTDIQATAIMALLGNIVGRLASPNPYPDRHFEVVAVVPAIHLAGLNAILLTVSYNIPSTDDHARDATIQSLTVLGSQIFQHGFRALDANIQISQLKVGTVNLIERDPLLTERVGPPIIFAVSFTGGITVEVTKLGAPYAEPVTAMFEAARHAFNTLASDPPTANFFDVRTAGSGGGKEATFYMGREQGTAGALSNAGAAAVAAAFVSFLTELPVGDIEFQVFINNPEYKVVAHGEIMRRIRAGSIGMPVTNGIATA